MLLEPARLRAEWYEGTTSFFETLDAVLSRISAGRFTYEELLEMPGFVGSECEIMMHRHDFEFLRVQLPIKKGRDPLEDARSASGADIASILLRGA
jgi:hypothetical protein